MAVKGNDRIEFVGLAGELLAVGHCATVVCRDATVGLWCGKQLAPVAHISK